MTTLVVGFKPFQSRRLRAWYFFCSFLLCLFNGISFTFVTSGTNIDTVLISYVIFDPSNSLIWMDTCSGFHGSFHGSPEKAAAYISPYLFICSILQGCISIMYVINLSSDQLIVFSKPNILSLRSFFIIRIFHIGYNRYR